MNLANPANRVQIVRHGGYPFGQQLDDAEIAAVPTYVRRSWGNRTARMK